MLNSDRNIFGFVLVSMVNDWPPFVDVYNEKKCSAAFGLS